MTGKEPPLKDEPGAGARRVARRSELAIADTWDLQPLYADDPAWERDFAALQQSYPGIAQFRGTLAASPTRLLQALEAEKRIDLRVERLHHYASLRAAEDSAAGENLEREGRLQNLLTKLGEASAFLAPEIQAIPQDLFAEFMDDPVLESWHIRLRKLRRLRPHTLSEAEERLLALGHSALRGHRETFSQLTDVDMKFDPVTDEKGVQQPLSQSAFSSFIVNPVPRVRREAFHTFYREFGDHQFTLASSLASSVRADVFSARARNYSSAIEQALFADDVPLAVYDNLISTVRANLDPLHRYYELRRKVLKLDEIHQYDTYVPMVGDLDTKLSFDQAVAMVLEALHPLGADYVETLRAGLASRWCDRYENKGKRSGAFSSSSYGNPPYMLMNYKSDVFSDVYTLAHEAGHSMHSWYAQREQLYQDYDYPIFLAEVASTFNEELLTHHLLEKTTDPRMRAYILNRQVDDIRGTVYRQTMFAEFEKRVHAAEEAGEALTLQSFRAIYHELLEAFFGGDFTLDPELDLECLRIPHFYNAFYVYKYSTGMSAAVSLSDKVLAGQAEAVPDYLGFLKSGGSQFPIPTLCRAGVDMSTPEPIQRTLDLFARRVTELEELLG